MTHQFEGTCQCQSSQVKVTLPHPLRCYAPRACDCDYCTSKQIHWLSDPAGKLELSSRIPFTTQQQGSEQATFMQCGQCGDVLAVCFESAHGKLGAVNTQVLLEKQQLKSALTVSPKNLSAERKAKRWSKVWMPTSVLETSV